MKGGTFLDQLGDC